MLRLNTDSWHAIVQLRDRSKKLFGDALSAEWYLFPRSEGFYNPDPTQPMGAVAGAQLGAGLVVRLCALRVGRYRSPGTLAKGRIVKPRLKMSGALWLDLGSTTRATMR